MDPVVEAALVAAVVDAEALVAAVVGGVVVEATGEVCEFFFWTGGFLGLFGNYT